MYTYIHSYASLMAQMVRNPPAMWKTWVQTLGWEVPWRRAWQSTPVFLPGESCGQRSPAGYSLWTPKALDMTERLTLQLVTINNCYLQLKTSFKAS